jgi:hypothetical protein
MIDFSQDWMIHPALAETFRHADVANQGFMEVGFKIVNQKQVNS